jgi:isoleucyl-tRNA synthetase
VLYRIAACVASALAPILSFTAEEVWQLLPGDREDSVHLALFPSFDDVGESADDEAGVRRLLGLRDRVLAALEELRQQGAIGKSEEARVMVGGDTAQLDRDLEATGMDLAGLLIVSQAGPGDTEGGVDVPGYPGLEILVLAYEGVVCSRCWRRFDRLVDDAALPDLCPRCHDVVRRLLDEGRAVLEEPAG